MTQIELKSISKAYGSVQALVDGSLRMEDGEFLALLGPSGCGKTTTLNIIAGFIQPEGGDILIDGRSVLHVPAHRRGLGVVFQNYALFPHMTVAKNIAFGLKMRGVGAAEIRKRVDRVLELVRLGGLGGRYPAELSGGQQQRVALARALVIEPAALLLDEPLSNLDAGVRAEMRVELRAIQREVGISVILVTHDQVEALAMADRIGVMHGGRFQQVGTPMEVYEDPVNLFVATFMGSSNIFHGVVEDGDGGATSVRSDEGFKIAVARRGGATYRSGDKVAVVVRPERMRLASAPSAGENGISARLRRKMYLGSSQNVYLDIGKGRELVVTGGADDAGSTATEEELTVCWRPADCRIVPV